jgi:hypothetical protein
MTTKNTNGIKFVVSLYSNGITASFVVSKSGELLLNPPLEFPASDVITGGFELVGVVVGTELAAVVVTSVVVVVTVGDDLVVVVVVALVVDVVVVVVVVVVSPEFTSL